MNKILLAIACLAATAAPALAKTERIGGFVLVDDAPEMLILAGEITPQTPLDFKTAMLRRPETKILVLSSPGGNVTGGLLLADDVHTRGLNTYVPADTGCYSACAYVFLAGHSRLAEGELGVHQFSGPGGNLDTAQQTVANVLDILTRFEVAQPVISQMLRTGAEDMHVFTRAELSDYELNKEPGIVLGQTLPLRTLPEDTFGLVEEQDAIVASAPDKPEPVRTPEGSEEPPVGMFAIYEGLDFYGNDVDKIRASGFAQCFEACAEDKACYAITFNTDPKYRKGPNCFLKDGTGRVERYEQAISGLFLRSDMDPDLMVGGKKVKPTEIIRGDD